MKNYNPDIIYVRAYNSSLVPMSKVNIVTIDPNNGQVSQEIPLQFCIEKLIYENLNSFEKLKSSWNELDDYNLLEK